MFIKVGKLKAGFNVRERNPASGAITENFIIGRLGLRPNAVSFVSCSCWGEQGYQIGRKGANWATFRSGWRPKISQIWLWCLAFM